MHTLHNNDELKKWLTISVVVHLSAAAVIALVSSRPSIKRDFYSPSYKVNLVTLEKPKRIEQKRPKVAAMKKKSSTSKKSKAIRKKKPAATSKAKQQAIKKRAPIPAADPSAAIAAIKEKHESEMAIEKIRERVVLEREAAPDERTEGTSRPGERVKKISVDHMDDALKEYYDQLADRIHERWVSPGIGNFEGMVTIISVTISPSGKLIKLEIEEGSGNGFYDESVKRAVIKSAPFPPLPEGYAGGLEVGFRFKP